MRRDGGSSKKSAASSRLYGRRFWRAGGARRLFSCAWTAAFATVAVSGSVAAQSDGPAVPETDASALDAFLAHPLATIGLIIVSALVGGVLTRLLFRPSAPRRMAALPPPDGSYGRREPSAAEPGMIFRGGREEADRAVRRVDPAAVEARRVFKFFADSFDVREQTADAVIAYLERLGDAIERLRRRLEDAETKADRMASDKAARDVERRAGVDGPPGAAASPALRIAMEGVRTARTAIQPLRSRADQVFALFAAETALEDTLRRVAALHSAHSDGGPIDPAAVAETWPHALWRAEALLGAYFPSEGAWGDLRDGVATAGVGLRRAFREVGVVVGHVRLLSTYRPNDGEIWSDQLGALADLDQVRSAADRAAVDAPVIVDCEAFGYVDRAHGVTARARLIVDRG